MPDEVEVGGVVGFGRKERLKVGVGVFDRHFFGAQAEAAGDPVDVGIYREGGAAQRELEDDGRRLRPHAVEPGEPGAGFFEGQAAQKFEVERAAFLGDGA